MSVKFKNYEQFMGDLKRTVVDGAELNIRRAMTKSVMLVDSTAKTSILRGPKTGGTVIKYGPSRTHEQSAAGEAPASDTGYLANSISHEVIIKTSGQSKEFIGIVSASAEYAASLEFGTVNMEARPFLRPALIGNRRKIEAIFKRQGIIK